MPSFPLPPFPNLPVVEALPRLLAALESSTRAVLEAPPGAGKTTVVPLALLNATWRNGGKILVLEPRQLAVRGAAARLAQLLGEPVGRTVGYRVRVDSNVSDATRIEVITEGILTRMVQDDPALEGVAAVVFDEFHERSLNADLGLALALDVQSVLRDDLRILLMSATLEAQRLGAWLPGPVVSSAGFLFPIATHYLDPRAAAGLPPRPRERLAQLVPRQVRQALETHASGDILVFLPGQGDLQRVHSALDGSLPPTVSLHLLHGELPLEKQQEALRPAPAGRRKVILSTSIAETSLTIEGVAVVIDSGFSRVPRYVPRTGFSTLETVPVSQAEADQRRGRAGRLGPGTCYRLYTEWERESYPRHRLPEIRTAELSGLVLETAVWGAATPAALRWLDAPPPAAVGQATDLLLRLGALHGRPGTASSPRPDADAARPVLLLPRPTESTTRPTQNTARPTQSSENSAGKCIGHAGKCIGQAGKCIGQAGESVGQAGDSIGYAGENVGRPGEALSTPGKASGRPERILAKPGEILAKPKPPPLRQARPRSCPIPHSSFLIPH